MELFGVGGLELVLILVIMIVVAGPKRMMTWAFVMGKYAAKLKGMWAETSVVLQRELDEVGIDVKVPQNMPTRGSLNREMNKAISPFVRPLESEVRGIKEVFKTPLIPDTDVSIGKSAAEKNAAKKKAAPADETGFGTWTGTE